MKVGPSEMAVRLAIVMSISIWFSLSHCQNARAEEVSASDSQGVNVTIYNQNFGLVKDTRVVQLKDGINYLRFEDVAAQIDPTTVSFSSLTAPNSVVVREQNYQYDLVDPTTILRKSIGKPVKFRQYTPGGGVHEISGTLLNAPSEVVGGEEGAVTHVHGLVVKTADGVILNPVGEVELAELPPGLVSRPSLYWKLEATKSGAHKTEIAYQTAGLNWHADYVAIVNNDDTLTDLTGWVTLDNKSGASYKNAGLKLIAGDVHRVQEERRNGAIMARGMMMAPAAAPQFEEQSFAEYHLYSLQNKTDVNDNETKQLTLFTADGVPVKKQFVFDPAGLGYPNMGYIPNPDSRNQKVQVKLELSNSKENQLGMPLPKGKVRVYKKDSDGSLQFIGEDAIDHTPKGEKVRLLIGNAFDVVGERKQMNVQRISDREHKYSVEIDLRNHKESAITVTCVEHSFGDWKISNNSHDYSKRDSHTFEFAVPVPANGEAKVFYDISVKY